MGVGVKDTADLVSAGLKLTSSQGTVALNSFGFKSLHAVVTLITTSGTIAGASVWLEGSIDGENWWPMPLDNVIQAGAAALTNWQQLGTNAVVGVTTAGLSPIMLLNTAATITASNTVVGLKTGGLPSWVRAAYHINSVNGALNFMLRATVTQ